MQHETKTHKIHTDTTQKHLLTYFCQLTRATDCNVTWMHVMAANQCDYNKQCKLRPKIWTGALFHPLFFLPLPLSFSLFSETWRSGKMLWTLEARFEKKSKRKLILFIHLTLVYSKHEI